MIASIISFCTNEYRFLEACIAEARCFSQQIIVSVCDHFFDGTPENYALLEEVYKQFPDCTFIEFSYDPAHLYGTFSSLQPGHVDWVHQWHNSGRYASLFFIEPKVEYIFLIDADEVAEGKKIRSWLDTEEYRGYDAMRLSMYWYFREARFRAKTCDDLQLIVKKAALRPEDFLDLDERMGTYMRIKGKKIREVKGIEGAPMVHHYSWVRTKEEMLQKTRTWGHHWERSWPTLIEEEFSRSFNGVDFCRGYHYEEITPHFDPLQVEIPSGLPPISLEDHRKNLSRFPHVRRVDASEIFRIDLVRRFAIHE